MRQQLDADPSVTIYRQYADLLGLRYDVEDCRKVTLPAYAGEPGPHARPRAVK